MHRFLPRIIPVLPLCLLTLAFAGGAGAQTAFSLRGDTPLDVIQKALPFQNNSGQVPPAGEYSGPLFSLNHNWPTAADPLKDAPWQKAIGNGPITTDNAAAYASALKTAVSENARALIMHYDSWDAAKASWYNEPWLGSLREAIHGTYVAGEFGPAIFPDTGLRATFNTHVLTYYDQRAAYSLFHLWGDSAMHPTLQTENAQFVEGSIVVKAAMFASTDLKQPTGWWDAMNGAQEWPLYIPVGKAPPAVPVKPRPKVWPSYVAQFDIIVKDTQSSPQTGWVFMTLVYDASAPGDVWDKMVPLGVQWGNDPEATTEGATLTENWINPKAPLYSTQTLGWGGRLSGPNDGGRNDIVVDGKPIKNAPDSGCMSCHSTAQWNIDKHEMVSFLLPSFATDDPKYPGFFTCNDKGERDPNQKTGTYICSPAPGSADWMKWFQNRLGDVPMDQGSFATDFDEVFSFKSLPLWWAATNPKGGATAVQESEPAQRVNQYTGAPLPQAQQ